MKALSIANRALLIASLASLFGIQASAENRGGVIRSGIGRVPFRTYGSPSGFGNIIFPGTGSAPPAASFGTFPISPFISPNASFADRLGATVSGSPAYTGAPAGFRSRFGRFGGFGGFGSGPVVVPYPYPVFVGGYGYGYDAGGYPQQPATIVVPQPPAVTINQGYTPETAQPVIREYGPSSSTRPSEESNVQVYQAPSPEPATAAEEPPLFLIALKDSTVYSAVAYWVEGETLHYITPQGKHNQVSLSLVDRSVSERLNRGRQIEFRLPR